MTDRLKSWVPICNVDELRAESMHPFEVGAMLIVVYLIGGQVYATNNVCPHAFALFTDGWLEDGVVECPLHGAQFAVTSGDVLRGPADCAVETFSTRVTDGVVELLLADQSEEENVPESVG